MRILLLSAPYVKEYMRNARCDFVSLSATQWYPLLLGYCGAYLEGAGHEVKLVDAPAHYLDHDATAALVRAYRPDLLVLYTGRLSEQNDLDFAEPLIEELGCDAVIAGPFAGIDPAATLGRAKRIDKLAVGEFEKTVGEIAEGKAPAAIAGLHYKDGDTLRQTGPRALLTGEELDRIPFVSRFFRKQVDVARYKTPSEFHPFMDILTGRGCAWGHCTYCLWVHTYITGSVYNQRSIENVVEEFEAIRAEMPEIRSVMLQDDTFTEERAAAFSEAKLRAGNTLPWSCYARANMSYETLVLMHRANVRNLHVGFESADPEVLRRIRKGVSVERATRFMDDARRAGVRVHGDFAIGFPGETEAKAQATVDWAYRLNPHTAQFQLMIPFPGTPFHEEMKEAGWLNDRGEPDMPQFDNERIRAMAKKGYRTFYLSPKYAWKCLRHPYEHFFGRLKTIVRAVPAMFWQRWSVG